MNKLIKVFFYSRFLERRHVAASFFSGLPGVHAFFGALFEVGVEGPLVFEIGADPLAAAGAFRGSIGEAISRWRLGLLSFSLGLGAWLGLVRSSWDIEDQPSRMTAVNVSDRPWLFRFRDERWVADSAQPSADLLVVDQLPLTQKVASIRWASLDVATLSIESEGCGVILLLLGGVAEASKATSSLLRHLGVVKFDTFEPEPVTGELCPQVLVGHASDLLRTTAFRHGLKDIGPVWLRHLQAFQDCCELSVVLRLCNGECAVIGGQPALLTVENSSLFPHLGQLCPEPEHLTHSACPFVEGNHTRGFPDVSVLHSAFFESTFSSL